MTDWLRVQDSIARELAESYDRGVVDGVTAAAVSIRAAAEVIEAGNIETTGMGEAERLIVAGLFRNAAQALEAEFPRGDDA